MLGQDNIGGAKIVYCLQNEKVICFFLSYYTEINKYCNHQQNG